MTTPRTAPVARTGPVPGAPYIPRTYLPREGLWRLLDEASLHAVTVVVAPAGAGKTMGVAGWLARRSEAIEPAWCSASAATTVAELEELLGATPADEPGPPRLAVVDDAHLLPAACLRILTERLSSAPGSMRVVLLARWDLPISPLVPQLLGDLTVLRGDALLLTEQESRVLALRHAPGMPSEVLDTVVERAAGWCAALVLASRASATMPLHGNVEDLWRSASGSLADLVAGEVFVGLRPQERHLLLCVASEPDLTEETARHVTRDLRAGEVLDSLVATGLLVSRASSGSSATPDRYRVHPLLLEVVRRRLVVGGVDVQRARGTIARAARTDLARGDVTLAVRRLMAADPGDAAQVIAEEWPRVVLTGRPTHASDLFSEASERMAEDPAAWTAFARAAWRRGDIDCGQHWSERLLRHDRLHPGTVPPLEVHDLMLRRARSGCGADAATVAGALTALRHAREEEATPDPRTALLLMEIGVAQAWLGDLDAAEAHLSEAELIGRSEGLTGVVIEASSHLALTHYARGREQASRLLAEQLLSQDDVLDPGSRGRSELALMLTWFTSFPLTVPGGDPPHGEVPADLDDPTSRFFGDILRSRLALLDGSVASAQSILDDLAPRLLPRHLRVIELMERAGLATISGNQRELRQLGAALTEHGADADALWVAAAAAHIAGDMRVALDLYRESASRATCEQPPTAAVALACAAQVAAGLGDDAASAELLVRAVEASDARRLGTPFLGWSRHGTRLGELLGVTTGSDASPWWVELREACADLPGIAALFAPVTATEAELASVDGVAPVPSLSPREREVLLELARGSTYGDAARNLFVSENTVKTHVSSVYAKLSVGRRSEALAVARTLHLI